MKQTDAIIEIKDLGTQFGDKWVHKNLNLSVYRGEIIGIIGGSGSGKTTLLREILMLQRPTTGSIKIFGQDIHRLNYEQRLAIQKRTGVLFQQNALFSSLTVMENVAFPLVEHTNLDKNIIEELALLKILLTGLSADTINQYPSELSGGMQKRAALARAIVFDPELIFLDEPSAGLDPINASTLDQLILNLQKTMGLTIFIVTHDLDTLWNVTDRVAFLGEGSVLAIAPMQQLVNNEHKEIQLFFSGPRGRAQYDSKHK
jgi:phospholipid/cholesterol/gamma-HCH transport system ATP-binding protein